MRSVSFPLQVTIGGQPGTTLPPTSAPPSTLANPNGPGSVITVVGNGPNVHGNFVSSAADASDLWGILVVLAVIFVSIAATRWVFGRGRRRVAGPAGPPPESGR